MKGDNLIYEMRDGKMTFMGTSKMPTTRANFLIICHAGDWSGFRTLAECEEQFAELEAAEAKYPGRGYAVVERL